MKDKLFYVFQNQYTTQCLRKKKSHRIYLEQYVWQSFKILTKTWIKIQWITQKHGTERWCVLPIITDTINLKWELYLKLNGLYRRFNKFKITAFFATEIMYQITAHFYHYWHYCYALGGGGRWSKSRILCNLPPPNINFILIWAFNPFLTITLKLLISSNKINIYQNITHTSKILPYLARILIELKIHFPCRYTYIHIFFIFM